MADMIATPKDRLLNRWEVADLVCLSIPTIHRFIAAGTFPRQIKVGPRASRWRLSELETWMASVGKGADSNAH